MYKLPPEAKLSALLRALITFLMLLKTYWIKLVLQGTLNSASYDKLKSIYLYDEASFDISFRKEQERKKNNSNHIFFKMPTYQISHKLGR